MHILKKPIFKFPGNNSEKNAVSKIYKEKTVYTNVRFSLVAFIYFFYLPLLRTALLQ